MPTYICIDCRHVAPAGAPGRCPKCGGQRWHEQRVVERALAAHDQRHRQERGGTSGGRLVAIIFVLVVMGLLFVLCPLGLVVRYAVSGELGLVVMFLLALLFGSLTFTVTALANLAYGPGQAPAWMAKFVLPTARARDGARQIPSKDDWGEAVASYEVARRSALGEEWQASKKLTMLEAFKKFSAADIRGFALELTDAGRSGGDVRRRPAISHQ